MAADPFRNGLPPKAGSIRDALMLLVPGLRQKLQAADCKEINLYECSFLLHPVKRNISENAEPKKL
jgi:hypothetical protein